MCLAHVLMNASSLFTSSNQCMSHDQLFLKKKKKKKEKNSLNVPTDGRSSPLLFHL